MQLYLIDATHLSPPSPFIGDQLTGMGDEWSPPKSDMQVRLSGAPLFDLRSRSNADGNAPRLHRLGNFPHQLDLQQTILECRAFDLDIVREIENPLELAGRNSLVQVILVGRLCLAS